MVVLVPLLTLLAGCGAGGVPGSAHVVGPAVNNDAVCRSVNSYLHYVPHNQTEFDNRETELSAQLKQMDESNASSKLKSEIPAVMNNANGSPNDSLKFTDAITAIIDACGKLGYSPSTSPAETLATANLPVTPASG